MDQSELIKAEMRGLVSEYLQLAAKIKHIEAEQAILKTKLEADMNSAGVLEVEGTDGKAVMSAKNAYKFDVAQILKVVPGVVSKLKISNEDFNKVLVGNEAALANARVVTGTTYPITISATKK